MILLNCNRSKWYSVLSAYQYNNFIQYKHNVSIMVRGGGIDRKLNSSQNNATMRG